MGFMTIDGIAVICKQFLSSSFFLSAAGFFICSFPAADPSQIQSHASAKFHLPQSEESPVSAFLKSSGHCGTDVTYQIRSAGKSGCTGSVVVPFTSDTTAISCPVTALSRLDFPVLRRPKKLICTLFAEGAAFRLREPPPDAPRA